MYNLEKIEKNKILELIFLQEVFLKDKKKVEAKEQLDNPLKIRTDKDKQREQVMLSFINLLKKRLDENSFDIDFVKRLLSIIKVLNSSKLNLSNYKKEHLLFNTVSDKEIKHYLRLMRYLTLNQKKINEVKEDYEIPGTDEEELYEIEKLYPFLACREKVKENISGNSIGRDARYVISGFKSLISKYRFCFSLSEDVIAKIKYRDEYKNIEELSNHFYVFTNIDDNLFEYFNYTILYDAEQNFYCKYYINRINTIIQLLRERRYSEKDLKNLQSYIGSIDRFSYKSFNKSSKINQEFIFRFLLNDENFYKVDIEVEQKEVEKYEDEEVELFGVKSKKKLVKDSYLKKHHISNIDFSVLKFFLNDINYINRIIHYENLRKKEFFNFISSFFNIDDFEDIENFIEGIDNELYMYFDKLGIILYNYRFLDEPYSKKYRKNFNKVRANYSLYKTHKILRMQRRNKDIVEEYFNKVQSISNSAWKNNFLFLEKDYRDDLKNNSLTENMIAEREFLAKEEKKSLYNDLATWQEGVMDGYNYSVDLDTSEYEEARLQKEYDDMLEVEYRLNEYKEDLFSEISSMEEKLSKIEGIDLHKLASNEDEEPLELEEHYEAVLEEYNKYFS